MRHIEPGSGGRGGAAPAPRWARLAAAVATVALTLLAVPAGAEEPDGPGPAAARPDWSTVALFVLGGARDGSVAGGPDRAVAAGVELLLRWRWLLAGVTYGGTAADGRAVNAYVSPQQPGFGGTEGDAWGLAAGAAWAPSEGTRLQLLLQGGSHRVSVESNLVLPPGQARLPYVGLEAAALALWGDDRRHPVLLFARRAGFVLLASVRTDLGHTTVRPGVPPEVTSPPTVRVGGVTLALQAGAALEW